MKDYPEEPLKEWETEGGKPRYSDEDIERWAEEAESEEGYTGDHLGPARPGTPRSGLRVLITGSRNYNKPLRLYFVLDEVDTFNGPIKTIVHGGASGADSYAGIWARERGITEEVHMADWDRHGRAAGPIRNQEMVDLGADLCIAFPQGESRGTRHCIAAAHKAGIQVAVIDDVVDGLTQTYVLLPEE